MTLGPREAAAHASFLNCALLWPIGLSVPEFDLHQSVFLAVLHFLPQLASESQRFFTVQNIIQHSETFQKPPAGDIDGPVWLEIADHGAKSGIDIGVFDPVTNQLCFEIITLAPEACPLIGKEPQSNESFRAFCKALNRTTSRGRIYVLIQFHQSVSTAHAPDIGSDDRNSRVYRMVEDIVDEILTHRPGSKIEIGMRHAGGSVTSLM